MPHQCHVRVGDTTEKHPALPSSFPHCINKITPEPPLLQANNPSPLSLSLLKKSSRSLITNRTLHLTLCSTSLLYWEAQNWTLQMQPHQRVESTSFKQLATLFLTQPRRLSATLAMAVHYWHTDDCNQYIKLLLCRAVSQLVSPPMLFHP